MTAHGRPATLVSVRFLLVILVLLARPLSADPGTMCSEGRFGHAHCIRPGHFAFDVCQQIGFEAARNGLDPGFFARLIWQESRFDPNALSPANARGIAQFIDRTAALHGLKDSYNPAEALEKSAEYLGQLTRRFGNPGLAAVAYNGGERRAEGLLQGRGLAQETIDYVKIITGLPAEVWRDDPPATHDFRLEANVPFQRACLTMARTRRLSKLAPPEPSLPRWGIQLGHGKTKAQARAAATRSTATCRGLIAKEKMHMVPVKNRVQGKPGFIMARLGRNDRKEADKLCRQLRQTGCLCRVYRNR